MATIHVDVRLVTTHRKHGSSGAKPSKVRSAAASKFNAFAMRVAAKLNNTAEEKKGPDPKEEEKEDMENLTEEVSLGLAEPKAYGSHSGNIQVAKLVSKDYTPENIGDLSMYIANVTSYLEGKRSFDLKAAKYNYKTFKDALTEEYAKKYGTNLSEVTTTQYLNTLATKAFKYTSHQIVITITSDEEIVGAKHDARLGFWRLVIKSKMIYTEGTTLLSESDLKALRELPSDEVKLKVISITRIPAILVYDAQNHRYIATFKSRDNAIVYDSY